MPTADVRGRELIFANIPKSAKINAYCMGDSVRMAEEFRRHGFVSVNAQPIWNLKHGPIHSEPLDASYKIAYARRKTVHRCPIWTRSL